MLFRVVMAALVMTSILLATTAVVRTRPRLSVDRSVGLVALLSVGMIAQFVQERPQSLSLVLLPWIGIVAMRVMYADRWPRWWVIGLLVMVWSWFHGAGIIVGPLLLAAALVHALGVAGLSWLPVLLRSLRRGWLVIVVALVAPMAGPLGWGYYAQARKIEQAATGRIVEWSPPDANNVYVWIGLALILTWGIAVVHLAARSGHIWRTFRMDVLWIVPLLWVMTANGRSLGIGLLLLTPLVARRLAQVWTRPSVAFERIPARLAVMVVGLGGAVALVLTVLAAIHVAPVAPGDPARIWSGLATAAADRRVFVAYSIGGQAGLFGEVPVSIDGRADRYGGEGIDANGHVIDGRPGWRDTLATYPGTTDMVIPADSGLVEQLLDDGWTSACRDGDWLWLTAPGVGGGCPAEAAH